MSPNAANAFGPDSVRRNDQLDGVIGAGTTGAIMHGIDAIGASRIRGVGLEVGAGAFGADSTRIQMADVIQQSEAKLAARKRATALEAASPEGLQGTAEV